MYIYVREIVNYNFLKEEESMHLHIFSKILNLSIHKKRKSQFINAIVEEKNY